MKNKRTKNKQKELLESKKRLIEAGNLIGRQKEHLEAILKDICRQVIRINVALGLNLMNLNDWNKDD